MNNLLQEIEDLRQKLEETILQLSETTNKLKEYEEKAAKAEKESKMKSLFLANMSHEIRTPLNAIEGFSRIIAETDSEKDRMTYLEIIESNNSRVLKLVDEILDLSRVESGEIVMKNKPTNLSKLCKEIKQLFKFRCSDQIDLIFVEPKLPLVMNTDENRLTQVFANLISNALKHTSKGSIKFGYKQNEDQSVHFFVEDTGSGIAPEYLNQIFTLYMSNDAETNNSGYGLGLALCKIIVEKLGGKISVTSQLGKGTRFIFDLPFSGCVFVPENKNITFKPKILDKDDADNKGKLILIVEDEDSNYELVKIVLGKRYNLLRAKNGIEAVTLNDDYKPDLILMDIRMPGMNGLDATRIIKEVTPDVPVVALSAFAFENNIREAKEAGCDDFMAKPFKVEALIKLVDTYINK